MPLLARRGPRAILLAFAFAGFLALTSDYGDELNVILPACDRDACNTLMPNATASNSKEIERGQNSGKHPRVDKNDGPPLDANGNMPGIVTSHKTGARARVGIAYAARFQAYIDDLENNYGARILFMGGIRPGQCSIFSLHPCGKALDVCQLRRGVVDSRCQLPSRLTLAKVAASHGLFEGGRWCNSDYGHVQVSVTAGDCDDRRTRVVRQQKSPEVARETTALTSFY
jgi:hypothetical protein